MVRRRVTFLGWLVIAMVFLSAFFGTDVLNNALGFLFCFCAFMLFVEIVSLLFRKSQVQVRSVPVGVVHSGCATPVPFVVKALGRVTRCQLALYPRGEGVKFRQFYEAREPMEERRNVVDRVLKFYRWRWMNDQRAFSASESESLELAKGEERKVMLETHFYERGVWSLVDVRAKLPGVFGLLERSRKTNGERGEIYVAPQIYPVSIDVQYGAGKTDEASLETRPQVGESQEFLSMREYRPGDSWRKVNWKAMARTEKAMVQEYEEFAVPHYTVHWNTAGMSAVELETAAAVTASVVHYFANAGEVGQVIITHGEGARDYDWSQQYEELMRALAEIQREELWAETTLPENVGLTYQITKEATEGLQNLVVDGARINGINIAEGILL